MVYSKSSQEARKPEEKLKGRTGVESREVTQTSHVVPYGHCRDIACCSECEVGMSVIMWIMLNRIPFALS